MYVLFFRNLNSNEEKRFPIERSFTSVGIGSGFDIEVNAPHEKPKLLFQLVVNQVGQIELFSQSGVLFVNSEKVKTSRFLKSLDRVSFDSFLFVIHKESEDSKRQSNDIHKNGDLFSIPLFLRELARCRETGSLTLVENMFLETAVRESHADSILLLRKNQWSEEWHVDGCFENKTDQVERPLNTKNSYVFSQSIVNDCIQTKKPVYLESIVNHPYSNRESIVLGRIFSAASVPIITDQGDVVMVLFFISNTPGKSVRREQCDFFALLAPWVLLKTNATKKIERAESCNTIIYSQNDPVSPIKAVVERLKVFAPSDLPILILGETGTGKELFARAVHEERFGPIPKNDRIPDEKARIRNNDRHPFVAINCAAIPSTLIESTLFGHEKGAFTGAHQSQIGKFVQANNGTLFLDEIGDLDLNLQSKLLRVLQEQRVEPIGGREEIKLNVRFVAATHQDLQKKVSKGEFRADLYYRLSGAVITVPALRERMMDISVLTEHILTRGSSMPFQLSSQAYNLLNAHDWPGNVRELEQVLFRAMLLSKKQGHSGPCVITEAEIEIQKIENVEKSQRFWTGLGEVIAGHANKSHNDDNQALGQIPSSETDLKSATNQFTTLYIKRTLESCHGHRGKAALILGISERSLYRFLSDLS